jgi:hypothetical protein
MRLEPDRPALMTLIAIANGRKLQTQRRWTPLDAAESRTPSVYEGLLVPKIDMKQQRLFWAYHEPLHAQIHCGSRRGGIDAESSITRRVSLIPSQEKVGLTLVPRRPWMRPLHPPSIVPPLTSRCRSRSSLDAHRRLSWLPGLMRQALSSWRPKARSWTRSGMISIGELRTRFLTHNQQCDRRSN